LSRFPCWSSLVVPRLDPLQEWLEESNQTGCPRSHSPYDYNEVF